MNIIHVIGIPIYAMLPIHIGRETHYLVKAGFRAPISNLYRTNICLILPYLFLPDQRRGRTSFKTRRCRQNSNVNYRQSVVSRLSRTRRQQKDATDVGNQRRSY